MSAEREGDAHQAESAWNPLVALLFLAFFVWLSEWIRTQTLRREDYTELDPWAFETHVRDVFCALPGWTAEVSPGSHDMGLDVLATAPDGVRWAVQVKHYQARKTPGIKAVQEACFARIYHDCDRALVVVSRAAYTAPARRGAAKTGVVLWTADDLRRLQRAAQRREPVPPDLFSA